VRSERTWGANRIRALMSPVDLAARFGAALGLGLLLGLERERRHASDESFAGVRTLALVCLLGATAADVQLRLGWTWMVGAAFLAVTAIAAVSYGLTSSRGDVGATTEVAALLTFLIGALCGAGEIPLAAALTVATLLLLSAKQWTHRFAAHIEGADVEAALKFAIITVIVLPLLPDRGFGPPPFDVLNPYKIWLLVVLISALNFASFVLVKLVGPEHGIGITGLLGGLVSSTALTLGLAQRSRQQPGLAGMLTLGILLAWTVMFFRVVAVVAVIHPGTAARLAVALVSLGALNLGICAWLHRRHRGAERASVTSGSNPFELSEAIKFGLLFGVVLVVASAARSAFGEAGLYLAGALAGLTDVDPIALSMAELARTDAAMTAVAARAILIAVLSNTLVKTVMAAVAGSAELRRGFLPPALTMLGAGLCAALLLR